MFTRFLPRAPRGLIGRAALILIAPIVTIQLIVSIFFIQRHFDDVTRQMVTGAELEILHVLAAVAAAPPEARLAVAQAAGEPFRIDVAADTGVVAAEFSREFWDLSGRVVIELLGWHIPGLRGVDLRADPDRVHMLIGADPALHVTIDRGRVTAANPHQLLVLMVAAGVVLTVIAYLFLRAQLDPIGRLAAAAEAFGKGRSVAYRPAGAIEVRAAGAAFVEMRGRIERQIEQRTLLLSGVSHDLRTPLTRLKLGLAMLPPDEDVTALTRDTEEMERMLEAFLAFVRGDATETAVPTDPRRLAERAVADARRAGQAVTLHPGADGVLVPLRADAVMRALANLLGNAARHASRAEVSVTLTDRWLRLVVEDDGPGIPRDRREEALRPFTRLGTARDPNRGGGVGLGLAIAADIARSHGGSLRLGESTRLGGLRAELALSR